jgi:hypothetical protein
VFDAGNFGWAIEQRVDGRYELRDPPFDVDATVVLFLLIPGLFIAIGILVTLSLLGVPLSWFHFQPANWFFPIFFLAIGGTAFTFGAQAFLRRKWIIDSAMVVRCTDIKLTPIGWQRRYRLDRLEILHEVWDDESGVSESVVGRLVDRPGKTVIFEYLDFPVNGPVHGRTIGWRHPKFGQPRLIVPPTMPETPDWVPDRDEVAPQVWWLGQTLGKLSGLPLQVASRVRKAPDLSGD